LRHRQAAFKEGVGARIREFSQALEYLQVVRSRLVSPAGVKRVGVSCWWPVRLSLVVAEAADLSVLANPMVVEAADPSVRYWKNRDGAW
jgi:hypothetical protein